MNPNKPAHYQHAWSCELNPIGEYLHLYFIVMLVCTYRPRLIGEHGSDQGGDNAGDRGGDQGGGQGGGQGGDHSGVACCI